MAFWMPEQRPAPVPQWIRDWVAKHNRESPAAARTTAPGERVIPEGKRNLRLTSMGGSMRRAGFDEDDILVALLGVNEGRCSPPLHEDEVEVIAQSVSRYEPDEPSLINLIKTGKQAEQAAPDKPDTREVLIPASMLRKLGEADKWQVRGLIPAEQVTIFSALPKAGKTTWLSHLLVALGTGEKFCNMEVRPGSVIYVTEESETIWADRRDKIGLKDHVRFWLRPFRTKPNFKDWYEWLDRVKAILHHEPTSVLVLDTLTKLWPVENENDASEVTKALMPLIETCYAAKTTALLVHHLRKGDGLEATATRGSGGITAAVDSIIELRRYKPGDKKDRRRVLTCDARYDDKIDEMVVQLANDGKAYTAYGDRSEMAAADAQQTIEEVLPTTPPGMTQEEITAAAWPEEAPRRQTVLDALRKGVESGIWVRQGKGAKGSPYTYWRRATTDSVSVPNIYIPETETESDDPFREVP